MEDDEIITGHLSPCVRIFIESLLNGAGATSAGRDAAGRQESIVIEKGLNDQALQSEESCE